MIGARLLDLMLTTRDKGKDDAAPMCGCTSNRERSGASSRRSSGGDRGGAAQRAAFWPGLSAPGSLTRAATSSRR